MRPFAFMLAAILLLSISSAPAAEPPATEKGTFTFTPLGDQKDIPERYRLTPRKSEYQLDLIHPLPGLDVTLYQLRFPSPVKSATPENNTVYAEYYRPDGDGSFPCVIILDVTAGNQMLSRTLGAYLAHHRIAGLFVQMAYYGPRRPPGSKLRLMSPNIPHTIEAVRQTVLDLRMATAWMASRPELDPKRLGILGTSLGSFLSALTAEMEPRLERVVVMLGGGGLADAYYDHPRAEPYRKVFEALGGTKEQVKRLIAPVDPITCAANLKSRKFLMLAASRDDVVPPQTARWLWEASGKQKIVWYDTTHVGAALSIADGLTHILAHFQEK
jgi:dienelactone hydrolase